MTIKKRNFKWIMARALSSSANRVYQFIYFVNNVSIITYR